MGDQTLQYKPVNAETFISNHIVSVGIKGTFLGKGSIYIYLYIYIYISTPSTRKGSHAESKASHGRK